MPLTCAQDLLELHRVSATSTSRSVARMALLDSLGCIVAGAATPTAQLLCRYASDQGSAPQASVLGSSLKLSVPLAALVNGTAGHVLDYDDMSSTFIGHPSVVLVPTIFALAESLRKTGAEVIDAFVLGFEVDAWFGRQLIPRHYDAGWHSTSSIGIFGATAAASRLLGLDAQGMLNGLAIAASNVTGLRANFGTMTKSLHAGHAAEGGVRAAMLSARGFTANTNLFDENNSFFALYGSQETPRQLRDSKVLELDDSGIGIKPYACCGAGQSVIDAGIDLVDAHHPKPQEIAQASCRVSPMAMRIMPFEQAKDGLQAKYCLKYCLAVALLDGLGGLAQFEDSRVVQPDVCALMSRVSMIEDATMASGAGRFGVALELTMRDGTQFSTAFDLPRGHPQRPLDLERLEAKFYECATSVIGSSQASAVIEYVKHIDDLKSLEPLVQALCLSE